jgi:hypothetical protein
MPDPDIRKYFINRKVRAYSAQAAVSGQRDLDSKSEGRLRAAPRISSKVRRQGIDASILPLNDCMRRTG